MRVAVIGSRSLDVPDLARYLPADTDTIISGGAKGVDASARLYATQNHIPLQEFLPDYKRFGRSAPLKRNLLIIQNADLVLAFWDGFSTGTAYVIRKCRELQIPYRVYMKKERL